MHECPKCSQMCDCDLEDHEQPAPVVCWHDCEEDAYPLAEEEPLAWD
jgi:hypothetical protein